MAADNTHTDILLAGALAAFTIDLLIYPLDTIKTRIQSPDYAAVYRTSRGTVSRALFRGLYQGVGSVILATVPSAGAFFTTYEAAKAGLHRLNQHVLPSNRPLPTPLLNSLASSAGELVSCLLLTPAEVLKQNAQVITARTARAAPSPASRLAPSPATLQALEPFRRHPHRLFRGYTALVARNLPFTALHFPLFEHLRARALERRRAAGTATGSRWERARITAASAGVAGGLAAVITTPVDVVKTRIMLDAGRDGSAAGATAWTAAEDGHKGRFRGWRVGREVWRSEGTRGLFRGAALRGGWTAVGSGLYLSIYESMRAWLEDRRVANESKW